MLVSDIVRRNAAFLGDRPAVQVPGCPPRDWATMHEESNALGRAMLERGVRKGDRVAFLSPNCPKFLDFYFACAKVGAVGACCNVRLTATEQDGYLRHVAPTLALVHASLVPEYGDGLSRLLGDGWLHFGGGETNPSGIRALESFMAGQDDSDLQLRVSPDDPYQLASTSGTTGSAKAAIVTHRNALAGMMNWIAEIPVDEGDVYLQCNPMFFNPGGPASIHPVLLKGGLAVIPPRFTPEAFLELSERHRPTHATMVTTILQRVVTLAEQSATQLRSFKAITVGGSPIPVELLDRANRVFGSVLHPTYGMAETCSGGLVLRLPDLERRPRSPASSLWGITPAGRPSVLTEAMLVDEQGIDVAHDGQTVGEVVLRGDAVSPGYFRGSAEDNACYQNGWFRTGDLGVIDETGLITLVDRKKDIIITGGINVSSLEVERVIAGHPDVDRVAVIGIPDERWGEAIHAVIVPVSGSTPAGQDIIDFVASRLADYKKPRSIELAESLPLNANGKILKRDLRAKYAASRSWPASGSAEPVEAPVRKA